MSMGLADRQTIVHAYVRHAETEKEREGESETCYELLHATFDLVSFALLACLDHILFNRERERERDGVNERERESKCERESESSAVLEAAVRRHS